MYMMKLIDHNEAYPPQEYVNYCRPPHLNVNSTMDATFLSCTESSSCPNLVIAIPHPQNPNVFIRYWSPCPGVGNIYTHVPINPIGGFSKNNKKKSIMVYRVVMFTTSIDRSSFRIYQDRFHVLKVVDDYNPESIEMLKQQVRRIYYMTNIYHDNLLGISSSFVDEQSNKLCVVVDHHVQGSVRAIMEYKFPQGVPEDLILCVLRSVLKALKFLHGQQITHTDINAGHIYISDKVEYELNTFVIKLGFAASIYEEEDDDDENMSPYLPMASMSKWAAAPEVYYGNNQSDYSEKADIWLVGITALELAYGGLKVSNRNALEAMIKDISLPPPPANAPKMMMFKSYVNKLLSSSSKSYVNVDDGEEVVLPLLSSNSEDRCPLFPKFSESFIKMVMQCLTWDPEKRPSVDTLLSQPFFRNNLRCNDGKYLYDALMNKTPPSSIAPQHAWFHFGKQLLDFFS